MPTLAFASLLTLETCLKLTLIRRYKTPLTFLLAKGLLQLLLGAVVLLALDASPRATGSRIWGTASAVEFLYRLAILVPQSLLHMVAAVLFLVGLKTTKGSFSMPYTMITPWLLVIYAASFKFGFSTMTGKMWFGLVVMLAGVVSLNMSSNYATVFYPAPGQPRPLPSQQQQRPSMRRHWLVPLDKGSIAVICAATLWAVSDIVDQSTLIGLGWDADSLFLENTLLMVIYSAFILGFAYRHQNQSELFSWKQLFMGDVEQPQQQSSVNRATSLSSLESPPPPPTEKSSSSRRSDNKFAKSNNPINDIDDPSVWKYLLATPLLLFVHAVVHFVVYRWFEDAMTEYLINTLYPIPNQVGMVLFTRRAAMVAGGVMFDVLIGIARRRQHQRGGDHHGSDDDLPTDAHSTAVSRDHVPLTRLTLLSIGALAVGFHQLVT